MFKVGGQRKHYLRIRPIGNGVQVSRDAIGTRIQVEVSNGACDSWSVFPTLFGGNAFNGQSGFYLFFGLLDDTSIDRITVTWPDGTSRSWAARSSTAGSQSPTDGSGGRLPTVARELRNQPATGEVALIEGTLVLNEDFGAGYSYAVIVEEAKLNH